MNYVEKYVKNTSNLSKEDVQVANDYLWLCLRHATCEGVFFEVEKTFSDYLSDYDAPTFDAIIFGIDLSLWECGI